MVAVTITRDEVIKRSQALSSFPRFIVDIWAELDDPELAAEVQRRQAAGV